MEYKNQKGFAPLVIILLVVLGIGVAGGGYVLYKDKQQQEKLETQIQDLQNQSVDNTSNTTALKVVNKNLTISLVTQAGLPLAVEAKRQAIYRAAVEKNYNELAMQYNGNLNNINDFRDNWLPAKTQEIIAVLQMPFEFQPYIPPNGHTFDIEARYTWPLNRPELSQLRIVISEAGKWIYVGAGD